MLSLSEAMLEYRDQLRKGMIQVAYKGLMDTMLAMKTYLKNQHPDFFVSGSLYTGYMDMTYFSFTPPALKERNLKIAIVFVHEDFRFEAWLAGVNRQVQSEYWKLIEASDWRKYQLVDKPQQQDGILWQVLVENPDFGNLDALSAQIEAGSLQFSQDVEAFLAAHGSQK